MNSSVSDPLRRVLDCLGSVEARNGYFAALCPAHEDHNPSLHIREVGENDNRKVLLTCCAGCDREGSQRGGAKVGGPLCQKRCFPFWAEHRRRVRLHLPYGRAAAPDRQVRAEKL